MSAVLFGVNQIFFGVFVKVSSMKWESKATTTVQRGRLHLFDVIEVEVCGLQQYFFNCEPAGWPQKPDLRNLY